MRFFKYKNREADFKRLLRLWNRVTLSISKAEVFFDSTKNMLWNRVTLSIGKARVPDIRRSSRLWNRVILKTTGMAFDHP